MIDRVNCKIWNYKVSLMWETHFGVRWMMLTRIVSGKWTIWEEIWSKLIVLIPSYKGVILTSQFCFPKLYSFWYECVERYFDISSINRLIRHLYFNAVFENSWKSACTWNCTKNLTYMYVFHTSNLNSPQFWTKTG